MARIFLLVPEELADDLLEPLAVHYRHDPLVEPIVERRRGQRRSGVDRRMLTLPFEGESRRAPRQDRRQTADRRAPLLPRDLSPTLPPEFGSQVDQLIWAQRLDPVSPHHAALPTPALVEAIAAGHLNCTTELYWRCYEQIYARLREQLDALTADRATKSAFGRLLDRLGEFDCARLSGQVKGEARPFDLFLHSIVEDFASEAVPAISSIRSVKSKKSVSAA